MWTQLAYIDRRQLLLGRAGTVRAAGGHVDGHDYRRDAVHNVDEARQRKRADVTFRNRGRVRLVQLVNTGELRTALHAPY